MEFRIGVTCQHPNISAEPVPFESVTHASMHFVPCDHGGTVFCSRSLSQNCGTSSEILHLMQMIGCVSVYNNTSCILKCNTCKENERAEAPNTYTSTVCIGWYCHRNARICIFSTNTYTSVFFVNIKTELYPWLYFLFGRSCLATRPL